MVKQAWQVDNDQIPAPVCIADKWMAIPKRYCTKQLHQLKTRSGEISKVDHDQYYSPVDSANAGK